MGKCIFCRSCDAPFTTREHILPQSLGGGDWCILPDGLLCDVCQNRFGSEIEQQALADYPFSFFRVFLGIPTKKRKAPWFDSWEGVIRAALRPGQVGYDPSEPFARSMDEGRKTQIRLLAQPLRPPMVCRTLLKMGIEVVAADDRNAVFQPRFDAARNYALRGEKAGQWWYLQREDMSEASRAITRGVTVEEWTEGVQLAMTEIKDGAEIFHLKLLYLDMITPLDQRIEAPPVTELPEPEYRLFHV